VNHLYAMVTGCPVDPQPCTDIRLLGSDDGGRTWKLRSTTTVVAGVFGPSTLLGYASSSTPSSTPGPSWLVSTDGGRRWAALAADQDPVSAVPPGRFAACFSSGRPPSQCTVYAIDPATGRAALLATQPAITWAGNTTLHAEVQPTGVLSAGGALWLSGSDPGTGRSAVAVSADGGRTWKTTPLDGCLPDPQLWKDRAGEVFAYCTSARDRNAYLMYRSGDAGRTWQAVLLPSLPGPDSGTRMFFLLSDGTVVFARFPDGGAPVELWALRSGRWQSLHTTDYPAGSPDAITGIIACQDGTFIAMQVLYPKAGYFSIALSTDLRQWRPIAIR
jgi:hypothetical protein